MFFTIQDAKAFKNDLKQLIPLISTTAQIQQLRNQINDHKSKGNPGLLKAIGINIAFTFQGLTKVMSFRKRFLVNGLTLGVVGYN